MEMKERLKIPRQKMPEQTPQDRVKNFKEVPFGLTPELAQKEAERCLQCKKSVCVDGCPVEINIPEFIRLIAEGDFGAAARELKQNNSLPAICGRVCPQEDQCEKVCTLAKKFQPVAKPKAHSMPVQTMITGNHTLFIPSATPPMMTVAGPVSACSDSFLVGEYSSLVEYSVHLPINQPSISPVITLNATPGMMNPPRL